jgi:hypothetical protein
MAGFAKGKRGGFKSSAKKRSSPSDDEAPRTSKKAKFVDDGTPLVPKLQKDDKGDSYVQLNKQGTRRLGISEFKGNTLVNIREYYEKDGQMLPGKKVSEIMVVLAKAMRMTNVLQGISLTVEQYNAILQAAPLIERVLKQQDVPVVRPDYDGLGALEQDEEVKDGEVKKPPKKTTKRKTKDSEEEDDGEDEAEDDFIDDDEE